MSPQLTSHAFKWAIFTNWSSTGLKKNVHKRYTGVFMLPANINNVNVNSYSSKYSSTLEKSSVVDRDNTVILY